MGKLLVRKSGKVQLVLGKVTLDVTMGTPCSFLQVLGGRRDGICGAAPQGGTSVTPLEHSHTLQRGKGALSRSLFPPQT